MTAPGVLFTLVLALAAAGGAAGVITARPRVESSPGVVANERITSVSGAALLVLSAAIAVTILRIYALLPAHYFIGFLMLGPLAVKLGSTGYRFIRYYTGNAAYRATGPPRVVLRLSAPVLVVATIAVFATGIELWLFGYRYGTWWYQAHVVSFLVWTAALAVHLLGHTRRSAQAAWQEGGRGAGRDAFARRSLVIASLVLGAMLAVASLLYATPFPPPLGSG